VGALLGFKVTVALVCFARHRLTEALDFVKKNADYTTKPTDDGRQRKLLITGVNFTQKFATAVETELNLRSECYCLCIFHRFFNHYCENALKHGVHKGRL